MGCFSSKEELEFVVARSEALAVLLLQVSLEDGLSLLQVRRSIQRRAMRVMETMCPARGL